VSLRLAGWLIEVENLSAGQQAMVAAEFGGLATTNKQRTRQVTAICNAARLGRPVGMPLESFAVNGEYAPRVVRDGSLVEITGFNSVVLFERGPRQPLLCSLAVAAEDELASPFVLGTFLRTLLAYLALDWRGVLLHCAGILHHGRAYLFAARSNVGKTTLGRKALAAGFSVLSDEMNLALPCEGGYRACSVPFTGELRRELQSGVDDGCFPLGGVVLLEQGQPLSASHVRPAMAVAGLLTACPFVNCDTEELPALLDALTHLVSCVSVVRLAVGRDDSLEEVMGTLLRCCEHG
jgi:hypothetical protein